MNLPKLDIPSKPFYIKIEEKIDFLQLFRNIDQKNDFCFFLESLGDPNPDSRHAVIGFDPKWIINARKNFLHCYDTQTKKEVSYKTKQPYQEVANWFLNRENYVISRNYAGGLVGYLSYEAIELFEPTLSLKHDEHFPLFEFGVYTDGIVHDRLTDEFIYFYYLENRIEKVKDFIHQKSERIAKPQFQDLGYSHSKSEHAAMLQKASKEIKQGNTFQCQIGLKKDLLFKNYDETKAISQQYNIFSIYDKLRLLNPSPHSFYMKFNKRILLGASPELILRLRQGELESYPLAGTIHRSKNLKEDQKLLQQLF